MPRIVVVGGGGRMARALVECIAQEPDLQLGALVGAAGTPEIGRDAGELAGIGPLGVRVGDDFAAAIAGGGIAIDFSSPDATRAHVAACAAAGVPLVLGTTGHDAAIEPDFAAASARIPLLVAPNTSLGVTVLLELVARAARALPSAFDIEIVEGHHRAKRDAPSGTALALGHALAAARGGALSPKDARELAREGPRRDGVIGFAVVRGGDLVGEHDVRFLGDGEYVSISHRATDRRIFARGAVVAARWLCGQPPGRYAMSDIIKIKSES
jgi:4-hydroxy-tetrahydrodipicolinate reductase